MAPMTISAAAALLLGIRFDPTPQTAISYYLHRWILGQPLDTAGIVHEAAVYSCAPKELAAEFPRLHKTDVRYFFTTCKRLKAGGRGDRVARTAGEGSWVLQTSKNVEDEVGEMIGYSVKLFYKRKDGTHSGWLMEEYHCLLQESLVGTEERVFCKIYVSPNDSPGYTARQESAAGDHRQEPRREMPVQVQQVRQQPRPPVAVPVPVITQQQALRRPPATCPQSLSSSVQGQRRVMTRPVPVPVFTQPQARQEPWRTMAVQMQQPARQEPWPPVPIQMQQQARQQPRPPVPIQVQQQVRQQPRPPVAVPVPVITQQPALRRPPATCQTQSLSSSMQGQRRVMTRPVLVPVFTQPQAPLKRPAPPVPVPAATLLQAPMNMPAPQIVEPPCPTKMHPLAAVVQPQAPKKRPAPPVAEPPCTKKMRPAVTSSPQLPCPASREDPLPTPSVPLAPKSFTRPRPAWMPSMQPALASALDWLPVVTSPVAAPIEKKAEGMSDVEEEVDIGDEVMRLLSDDHEMEEAKAPIEKDEDDREQSASSLKKEPVDETEEDDDVDYASSSEKELLDETEKDERNATEEDNSDELNVTEKAAVAEAAGRAMDMDASSLEGLLPNEQGDDVLAQEGWNALKLIGDGEDDAEYLSLPLSYYNDKLFY